IRERVRVGGGCAAEAADEPAGLAAVDELGRVDVGERREPEARFANQLRVDAARSERDEWPEHGVLHRAGEQLDATLDEWLDEHRRADPFDGLSNGRLV